MSGAWKELNGLSAKWYGHTCGTKGVTNNIQLYIHYCRSRSGFTGLYKPNVWSMHLWGVWVNMTNFSHSIHNTIYSLVCVWVRMKIQHIRSLKWIVPYSLIYVHCIVKNNSGNLKCEATISLRRTLRPVENVCQLWFGISTTLAEHHTIELQWRMRQEIEKSFALMNNTHSFSKRRCHNWLIIYNKMNQTNCIPFGSATGIK
jgi:hypothetical protein